MEKVSRGFRNNNPGNIKKNSIKYVGEITPSSDSVFKQFSSLKYGYRAIFMLLYTYQKKYALVNIEQFITRYAPAVENNTTHYINSVSKWSGHHRRKPINTLSEGEMLPLVGAITRMENGVDGKITDIAGGWELFINSIKKSSTDAQ